MVRRSPEQVVTAERVAVQGPDRFWLEVEGPRTGPAAGVELLTTPRSRTIVLELCTTGTASVQVLVSDRLAARAHTVTLRPGRYVTRSTATRGGRYDLEVTSPATLGWRRRITGRI